MAVAVFEWTHVRAFLLVARHGSMSRAAQEGDISQPTLGRQISALESSLGVTLFDRHSTGLTLTPNGSDLLEHAEAMSASADCLLLGATGRSTAIAGTVRITASAVMAANALPPIIAALRREEPDIDLEIDASDKTGDLLRREADIAVRMYRPTQNNVIARHVCDVDIAAYASTEYLSRRSAPANVEELLEHDIVGYDNDDQIIRGLRAAGIEATRENFAVRCDNHLVYCQFVRAGLGIGFIARDVGDADKKMRVLFDGQCVASLPVWLVAHAELRTSARIRRVYDFLIENLQ